MITNNLVATYAAIVATGALALEIRRWFETGPRIKVRVQPNMVIAGDDNYKNVKLVVATVRNRGSVATTITNIGLIKYPNRFYRWFRIRGAHFVVPRPDLKGTGSTLPHFLESGTQWLGFIKKDGRDIPNFEDGTVVVGIYTSDRERPYKVCIPRNKSAEPTIVDEGGQSAK